MLPLKRFLAKSLRRSPDTRTEAPLWDHLDACGIDFRAPMADLVEKHGAYPIGWTADLDICTPSGHTPFLPVLDKQLAFQFSPRTDLTEAPDYFSCAVRANTDYRLNYAKAIHAMTRIFGDGVENSASNTVSRQWDFGLARMTCRVFPPHRQSQGHNARYDMYPDRRTEAGISIEPAWRPPLSDQELIWCETAEPVDEATFPNRQWQQVGPLTRDLPLPFHDMAPGPALSGDGKALIVIRPRKLVDIVPRNRLEAVDLHRMKAARGAAAATVMVRYSALNGDPAFSKSLGIAHIDNDHRGLDHFAERLSGLLELGLNTHNSLNY